MERLVLIHHAARRGHTHPPSSLAALRACLTAGARVVELDITPLSDGCFALLHDGELDHATNGRGAAFAAREDCVRRLRYATEGAVSGEPVGLLDQAVALVEEHRGLAELQLDLKPNAPLDDTVLKALLSTIEAVLERVRVTSMADWALRRLRLLEPELALGFDPLLYLAVIGAEPRDTTVPPFRRGAYGYADDHPLATRVWGPPGAYLAARAEALCAQAPPAGVWYLDADLLLDSLNDGFDWIAYLHGRGCEIDAWTLDAHHRDDLITAGQLAAAGVDRITTNNAPALAAALMPPDAASDEPGHRRIAY